jgi:hypothetical protein
MSTDCCIVPDGGKVWVNRRGLWWKTAVWSWTQQGHLQKTEQWSLVHRIHMTEYTQDTLSLFVNVHLCGLLKTCRVVVTSAEGGVEPGRDLEGLQLLLCVVGHLIRKLWTRCQHCKCEELMKQSGEHNCASVTSLRAMFEIFHVYMRSHGPLRDFIVVQDSTLTFCNPGIFFPLLCFFCQQIKARGIFWG